MQSIDVQMKAPRGLTILTTLRCPASDKTFVHFNDQVMSIDGKLSHPKVTPIQL